MYEIIEDYLDNDEYRKSFNELSKKTFKLDFEPWYEAKYLQERYKPYSIIKEGKIISNISINHFNLMINGEEKKAIQIGTVMTDEAFRGKGLSRRLMEYVLKKYTEEEYIMYLFANDSVLEFYPKLGFDRVIETSYTINGQEIKKRKAIISELDCGKESDCKKVEFFTSSRKAVSRKLGVIKDRWPLLAYCDDFNKGDLVCIEEDDIIVKISREEGVLNVYDILSCKDFTLDQVLEKITRDTDEKIILHFVPDESKYTINKELHEKDDDALFIRKGQVFGDEILFPPTSHT